MGLEKVVVERSHNAHTNSERTVVTFFSGEKDSFLSPKQIRVMQIHTDVVSLGNHWREYPELYGIIGSADFTLEDIFSKERSSYKLATGDRILIPERIALRVAASKGTVLYITAEETQRDLLTHKYDFRD